MKRFLPAGVLFLSAVTALAACAGCGHAKLPAEARVVAEKAKVAVSLSDPAACAAPGGPYRHIYITIADVAASPDSSPSAAESSFVDLTPRLRKQPAQVDLLGEPDDKCRLAMLGHGMAPVGLYRLVRVRLAERAGDSADGGEGNPCAKAGTMNCVVTSRGAVLPLRLPSGGQFDIGPGQMPEGRLVVSGGGTTELNISIDGCDSLVSVVRSGEEGQYAFEPAARAATLGAASEISGRVVNAATGGAIDGRAIVALEQKDAEGIDRIVMATTPDAAGRFRLCPVPSGDYDLAAAAVGEGRVAFAPTLLVGVPAGAANVEIELKRAGTINAAPATVVGQVTLLSGAARGFGRVRISALASGGAGSSAVTFTVPLPHSGAGTLTVAGPSALPYSFNVPAAKPQIGVFSGQGTQYSSEGASGPPGYLVEARGCGSVKTTPLPVRVTVGGTASAPILTISTCGPA